MGRKLCLLRSCQASVSTVLERENIYKSDLGWSERACEAVLVLLCPKKSSCRVDLFLGLQVPFDPQRSEVQPARGEILLSAVASVVRKADLSL
mmetsp:Transcript_14515/g.31176  ORF Transcript_14515/g.31176 Transcript_14515/m.31176 type:complete len:93 (+) Transcript_14515:118-396(+)